VKKPETQETRYAGGMIPVDDAVLHLIDLALAEDRGPGDWTSRWTVGARTRAHATIRARAAGVIAGVSIAHAVFLRLDPRVDFEVLVGDGDRAAPGDAISTVRGPARAVLTGERTALNFLQRLSGIATETRRFVDAVARTGVRILDTRNTTPGWRALEQAAVRTGGGTNHRTGLYDAVLIQENHVAVAGSLEMAISRVKDQNSRGLPIIVEVRDEDEARRALSLGVDRLLLDNMQPAQLRKAVRLAANCEPRPELEASGNITFENVRAIAETGVDFVSIGSLTNSAPALDLSLSIGRT
jgi:nicotinate-nucleotide pyrophosphorylase (carboxylating)